MKENPHEHDRFPAAVQRAFEEYPRITASDDFNQRVLERVLAGPAPSRFDLFCDRMDEIFARPVFKLVGAASLGGIFGLAGIAVLLLAGGVSLPASSSATPPAPTMARQPDDSVFIGSRMAWAQSPAFWMSYELWDERRRGMTTPKQPENSKTNKTGERSSACLVCVSSV